MSTGSEADHIQHSLCLPASSNIGAKSFYPAVRHAYKGHLLIDKKICRALQSSACVGKTFLQHRSRILLLSIDCNSIRSPLIDGQLHQVHRKEFTLASCNLSANVSSSWTQNSCSLSKFFDIFLETQILVRVFAPVQKTILHSMHARMPSIFIIIVSVLLVGIGG